MQAEVDFSIRADCGDIAFECLSGLEALEDFVGKNEAAVCAVDDRFVTQVGFPENDEINFLFQLEVRRCAVHVARDACGGNEPSSVLVDVDVDDVVFADVHADFLFTEGDEQILRQAPVKEGSDAGDGDAAEAGKLAWHHLGSFERGDLAVLGVEIEKNVDEIPDGPSCGHFAARKQDFSKFTAIEKKPEGFLVKDFEGCAFADDCHAREWAIWCGESILILS